MSHNISVSVIICTYNRARSLQNTLNALGKVRIPFGCVGELIVVDNASTDGTAGVVANAAFDNMLLVYLSEPKRGKAHALNSALAVARGEILVFTDDDVLPSEDWIEQIVRHFNTTKCDALVGKVILAPALERDWIRAIEKYYLAISDFESGNPIHWVGANAAFHRRCLQRVRAFDPELGSGALGNAEDTLFGCQLVEAGFKLEYAANVIVVHQPDESRLRRSVWLQAARQRGQSKAYLLHHWEHGEIKGALLKRLWFALKLSVRRRLQPPAQLEAEGLLPWERSYVHDLAFYEQYCIERRRLRNYAKHGLEKLDALDCHYPSRPNEHGVIQRPKESRANGLASPTLQ